MQQYTRKTVHTRSKELNHEGETPTRRWRRSVSKGFSLQLAPSSFSSHLFAHQMGRAMIWAFRSCCVNLAIQGGSGSHCTVRRQCCNRSFRTLCATALTNFTLPILIRSGWCTIEKLTSCSWTWDCLSSRLRQRSAIASDCSWVRLKRFARGAICSCTVREMISELPGEGNCSSSVCVAVSWVWSACWCSLTSCTSRYLRWMVLLEVCAEDLICAGGSMSRKYSKAISTCCATTGKSCFLAKRRAYPKHDVSLRLGTCNCTHVCHVRFRNQGSSNNGLSQNGYGSHI